MTADLRPLAPVDRAIRLDEVVSRSGLKRSALYAAIARGDFPRAPVRFDQWFDCPDCRHPATAVYLGRISCNRCGWPRQLKSED